MIRMKQLKDHGERKKGDRFKIGSEKLAKWLEVRELAERVKSKPAIKVENLSTEEDQENG